MKKQKPSLYEILEISESASVEQVREAYRNLTEKLLSSPPAGDQEDRALRKTFLDVAFSTLSDPVSRNAYDADLANNRKQQARESYAAIRAAAETPIDTHAIAAMGMPGSAAEPLAAAVTKSASSLKGIFMVIAVLMAAGFVVQVLFSMLASRRMSEVGTEAARAEERAAIQEYYHEHGVRPGSREEIEMLQAEARKKREEERAQSDQKRREEELERKRQREYEDAVRTADRVSADLQRAQEDARREEEARRMREEREAALREEQERRLVERERRRLGLQ